MNEVVKSPAWLEELIKFVGSVGHSISHPDQQQQRKTHKEESQGPRHDFCCRRKKGKRGIRVRAE